MALKDVKQYYLNILSQSIELKDCLKDFEQGLKDGYVTEDQVEDLKYDIDRLKENVDRLGFIMYLFELPKRNSKKDKYLQTHKNLAAEFSQLRADDQAVFDENTSVITHVRERLKALNLHEHKNDE